MPPLDDSVFTVMIRCGWRRCCLFTAPQLRAQLITQPRGLAADDERKDSKTPIYLYQHKHADGSVQQWASYENEARQDRSLKGQRFRAQY